jgi:20S proteasome subunit beta 2
MHRHQGQIGAALVLGGVDVTGPQLFTVAPHGSTDKLPYVTMGSGSLAAMAVFESYWKAGLNVCPSFTPTVTKTAILVYIIIIFADCPLQRESAVKLVCDAISAGIFNDLGSGSNVDVCVITASGTDMLRNYVKDNEKVTKERNYKFRRGTTDWKRDREVVRSFVVSETVRPIGVGGGDAMDTS